MLTNINSFEIFHFSPSGRRSLIIRFNFDNGIPLIDWLAIVMGLNNKAISEPETTSDFLKPIFLDSIPISISLNG